MEEIVLMRGQDPLGVHACPLVALGYQSNNFKIVHFNQTKRGYADKLLIVFWILALPSCELCILPMSCFAVICFFVCAVVIIVIVKSIMKFCEALTSSFARIYSQW